MSARPAKKQKPSASNGNGGIVDLQKELWQAAVTLRGSIEPADYKRYVLPLVFLRFLSIRYEQRRAELARLVAEPKSEYYRDKKALDDPDEYALAGALIVPPEARWDHISGAIARRDDEYFTPASIVKTLVAMLEPKEGVVFDPCCGSGGMFVQSDAFTKHSGKLSFRGQESKDFTQRLCRMNLIIHGLEGDIRLGDSYFEDKFATLKADYLLANPPFNDGSKGERGWGADRVSDKDPRRDLGIKDEKGEKRPLPLSPRNANTMWMMHFLHHLKDGGTAGFVMAMGELSNGELARLEVRKALVDLDFVDCVVRLSGQLFAQTQIPCALWLLSKNRDGKGGYRKRKGEMLFIDGSKLGALIPGSRKQKQLAPEEIERIAVAYRGFKRKGRPADEPGFCRVATPDEIREHRYVLTPGRYVGSANGEDDDTPFEERFPKLVAELETQFAESRRLEEEIRANLTRVGPALKS